MTLDEIDNKIHFLQKYYKSFLEMCCTVEIPEQAQREIATAYFAENHKLILERGLTLAQTTEQ